MANSIKRFLTFINVRTNKTHNMICLPRRITGPLNVEASMKLLRSLGVYTNVEKSSFLPSTEINF